MKPEHDQLLWARFRAVFDARWSPDELPNHAELRERFAFHMADAAGNLLDLADFYRNPDSCDLQELTDRCVMFFVDCVPHYMAAAPILYELAITFPEQHGVHDWSGLVEHEDESESAPAPLDGAAAVPPESTQHCGS